ncbi:MAG: DUF938 domain-containing protein [Pseudomonadota bacterium]
MPHRRGGRSHICTVSTTPKADAVSNPVSTAGETVPHFSSAADKNKDVILECLQAVLKTGDRVLEIASGTAQHALHFATQMPEVTWQPSDRDLQEYGLTTAIAAANLGNLLAPIRLDVAAWPRDIEGYSAVYSANCIHVMPTGNLEPYIRGAAASLCPGGLMMFYGPFKYDGAFTTPSNESFDAFLSETYPGGGIRDFEAVDALARENGLSFVSDTAMPANNQFIVWQRLP